MNTEANKLWGHADMCYGYEHSDYINPFVCKLFYLCLKKTLIKNTLHLHHPLLFLSNSSSIRTPYIKVLGDSISTPRWANEVFLWLTSRIRLVEIPLEAFILRTPQVSRKFSLWAGTYTCTRLERILYIEGYIHKVIEVFWHQGGACY